MRLAHRFTLPARLDVVWPVFSSLEPLASCFPGAVLSEVEGDDFAGTLTLKLGPMTLAYAGHGTISTRDGQARVILRTQGTDGRGNGTLTTAVTATLAAQLDQTQVSVETDLQITGKPAQLGKGVLIDASNRLVDQFVTCIGGRFIAGHGASNSIAGPGTAGEVTSMRAFGEVEGSAREPQHRPAPDRPRTTQQRSHQDAVVEIAGPLLKRYGPFVVVAAAVVVVIRVLSSKGVKGYAGAPSPGDRAVDPSAGEAAARRYR